MSIQLIKCSCGARDLEPGGAEKLDDVLHRTLGPCWSMSGMDEDELDMMPPSEGVDALLYEAWALIANASNWNNDANDEEWVSAAIKWRDRWHAYLDWARARPSRKG